MNRFIVDTNIVFSGILNTNSSIGDLLLNSEPFLKFYSVTYMRVEIDKHLDKIVEMSGMSINEVEYCKFQITKKIEFISEEQIPFRIWHKSANYVRDIDMDDIVFVALSEYMGYNLWTGDKKLMKGLIDKGFSNCISTQELVKLREEIEKSNK